MSKGKRHPMEDFFAENAPKIVAAIIWKFRHILSKLAVSITLDDLASMADALERAKSQINITITGHGNAGFTVQMVNDDVAAQVMEREKVNTEAADNMRKMIELRKEARELSAELLTIPGAPRDLIRAAQLLKELAREE